MCIICRMREQIAADNAAEAGAPGQTEGPAASLDREFDQVELNHEKAMVNVTNADALHKLAQAVKWLYDANFQQEAQQVANQLVSLLPASPNKAKEPQPTQAEDPMVVQPPSDEVAMPKELAELISKMRAAGFEVDAVRIPL